MAFNRVKVFAFATHLVVAIMAPQRNMLAHLDASDTTVPTGSQMLQFKSSAARRTAEASPMVEYQYIEDAGLSVRAGWGASVAVGDKVVGVPSSAGKIVVYADDDGTVTYNSDEGLSGLLMWCGGAAVGDVVVAFPFDAGKILRYEVTTNSVSYKLDSKLHAKNMYLSHVVFGDKVIGFPFLGASVLVYRIDTDTYYFNQLNLPADKNYGDAAAVGDKIIGMPLCAGKILVYEVETDTAVFKEDSGLAGRFMWAKTRAVGNKVVGIPRQAYKIVVYDAGSETILYKPVSCCQYLDGQALGSKVVMLPRDGGDSGKVLVYDVDTDTFDLHPFSGAPAPHLLWWGASVTVGNLVVGLPSTAGHIAIYDVVTNNVSFVMDEGLFDDNNGVMWRAAATVDNKIVALPWMANKILVTTTPTLSPTPAPTTPAPSPTCDGIGSCQIWEDPHVQVFDGLRISLLSTSGGRNTIFADYDSGDVWLVRTSEISIQARYLPDPDIPERNLYVRSIAVGGKFLKGNTLIVGSLDEKISWNGAPILESQTSDFVADLGTGTVRAKRHHSSHLVQDVTQTNAGVDIEFPHDVKLTVNRYKKHVNVDIAMAPDASGQDGLCGNFNCNAADDTLSAILKDRNPYVSPGDNLFMF